tara:strand:+ start:1874 stop:2266 length:393 start_codon:yes stop_codon:yes gene_type:complete
MKKTLLTAAIALCTLAASAQFSVMTTIDQPADGESWGSENFTNNMAVGYQLNDKIMVGLKSSGEDYNFFGRYGLGSNLYVSVESGAEISLDSLDFGVGYSFQLNKNIYIEPSYILKEDEGEFKIGVAYKL